MAELLLEVLVSARAPSQMGLSALVYRKRPITDVLTWVQCFGVYVGMLAKQFPDVVPELMSYMVAIIKASKDYEGLCLGQLRHTLPPSSSGNKLSEVVSD